MPPPTPNVLADRWLAEFAADGARADATTATTALLAKLRLSNNSSAELWQTVGEGLLRAEYFVPATSLLDAAVAQHPQAPELQYLRGNALRLCARDAEAESAFRNVLARVPAHRDAAFSLAFMLREGGRIYAAAEVMVALCRHRIDDVESTLAALGFLRECGAYAQAQEIATDAHAHWPSNPQVAAISGEILLALGRFEQARDALRQAVSLDPEQSAAWLRLGYCQRFENADSADARRIDAAWSNSALSTATRICAGFALGKACDEVGDFARAAAILRAANSMAQTSAHWHDADWQDFIARQLQARALPSVTANSNFAPIFIVGLPRTGTTLVATLLARHSAIRDRGELNWIPAMFAHLQAQKALSEPAALRSVAALIGAQMRRDDAPARYYIDKNPLNFRYLNVIAALFPNARIIHCRRGLRDTALSIWSQHFAHEDLGFSYAFSAIAKVAEGHARLMQHWRRASALRLLELDYATLVTHPAQQLQRLAEFLDIPDVALDGATSTIGNTVTTASVWQARQPMYTRALGRWRNYADYLPELISLFNAEP
jgi:tetratricopeptide (TPR) repeat protein